MKKILLDTNIFIYLEDNKITDNKVIELTKRLYDSDEYKIVIHPKTKEEIEKFKNEEQTAIFKSKIAIYKQIVSPPTPDEEFHKLVGCKNEHDVIDNTLLYAVQRNCVSYLITNDNDLKKKSKIVDLEDRVLMIGEALEIFTEPEMKKVIAPPFIEEKYLYQLDINDEFFNSLKEDYFGFETWFAKKQKEGAKAYVSLDKGKVTSFLMLKVETEDENYDKLDEPFYRARRLKVATMKVAATGRKIGESFIKMIIRKAFEENVEEIYVTVFPKHEALIDLLNEYGFHYKTFQKTTHNDGTIDNEYIYVKKIKNPEEYYPFIKLENRKCFIIPIRQEFHQLLFQESEKIFQLSIEDLQGIKTEANSIRKAYICNANTKQIDPGSIVLFYSSGEKKAITSLGIVDAVFNNFANFDEMFNLVQRRTAYKKEELEEVFKSDSLVILFKHYYSFDNYVNYDFLLENEIVKGPIQSAQKIEEEKLEMILTECKIDKKRYFI